MPVEVKAGLISDIGRIVLNLPKTNIFVESVTVEPKSVVFGDNVTITARVRNYSNSTATISLQLSIAKDGITFIVREKTVDVPANSTKDVSWVVTTQAFETGTYTVSVDSVTNTFEVITQTPELATIRGTVYDGLYWGFLYCKATLDGLVREGIGGFRFDVPPGTYTLTVESEGYYPDTRVITVSAGQALALSFPLTPIHLRPAPFYAYLYDATTGQKVYGYWHAQEPYVKLDLFVLRVTLTCDKTGESWTKDLVGGETFYVEVIPSWEAGRYTLTVTPLLREYIWFFATSDDIPILKHYPPGTYHVAWNYYEKTIKNIEVGLKVTEITVPLEWKWYKVEPAK